MFFGSTSFQFFDSPDGNDNPNSSTASPPPHMLVYGDFESSPILGLSELKPLLVQCSVADPIIVLRCNASCLDAFFVKEDLKRFASLCDEFLNNKGLMWLLKELTAGHSTHVGAVLFLNVDTGRCTSHMKIEIQIEEKLKAAMNGWQANQTIQYFLADQITRELDRIVRLIRKKYKLFPENNHQTEDFISFFELEAFEPSLQERYLDTFSSLNNYRVMLQDDLAFTQVTILDKALEDAAVEFGYTNEEYKELRNFKHTRNDQVHVANLSDLFDLPHMSHMKNSNRCTLKDVVEEYLRFSEVKAPQKDALRRLASKKVAASKKVCSTID